MKKCYVIDGCDEEFRTLRDVRHHVWLATGDGYEGRAVYNMIDSWPHNARKIHWDGRKVTLKKL